MKWYWLTSLCVVISGLVIWGFSWQRQPNQVRLTGQAESEEPPKNSHSLMQGIKLIEQSDESTAWEILAENAEFSDDAKVAVARGVRAQLFQGETALLSLEANQGTVQRATGDIAMRGRVRVIHQDGYTMSTDTLNWRAKSRQLYTDEDVSLEGPSVHITGTGLRSDVDQQRFHLERNVHASFRLQ